MIQLTIERISVREEDARFWKGRSVEVAENSPAESARARPRSAAGRSPLTYLEAMPNHERHSVSSAWLQLVGAFCLLVPNKSLVLKCVKT